MIITSKITGFKYEVVKFTDTGAAYLKQLTANDINKSLIGRLITVDRRQIKNFV